MEKSVRTSQLSIAVLLMAVMAATRFHHFGTVTHLPDASLALFFLAGFYLRSRWAFAALLTEAALIDFAAIALLGTSGWCVTPAYAFLALAYLAMWGAGRWYRGRHVDRATTLLHLLPAAALGTALAFLISNGSFYLFSGYFDGQPWADYAAGVMPYAPLYFGATLAYLAIAGVIHALFVGVRGATGGGSPLHHG